MTFRNLITYYISTTDFLNIPHVTEKSNVVTVTVKRQYDILNIKSVIT